MAQFDVFENPNKATNQAIPYLLDVQADLLDSLSTRVVVPFLAASAMGFALPYPTFRKSLAGNIRLINTPLTKNKTKY